MVWRTGYGHHGRVFDISVSPSGEHLVTASEDETARVWSLADLTQTACLTGHTAEVMRASWNADESLIATGAADQTARIWKLKEDYGSECVAVLDGHSEELYCSEWVFGGDELLTASGCAVSVWDATATKKASEVQLESTDVYDGIPSLWRETSLFGCIQSPCQPLMACPCSDGLVHIVAHQNKQLVRERSINVAGDLDTAAMCMSAAFSTDGKMLAVATSAKTVAVYDCRTWKILTQLDLGHNALSCRWRVDDGRQQLYVAANSSVLRFDPSRGTVFAAHSPWHTRRLLSLASTTAGGAACIVASGDVVEDEAEETAPAEAKASATKRDTAAHPQPEDAGSNSKESSPNAAVLPPTGAREQGPEGQGLAAGGARDEWGAFGLEGLNLGRSGGLRGDRRGRGRRRSKAVAGGKSSRSVVPPAVGRAPLEVWDAAEFTETGVSA